MSDKAKLRIEVRVNDQVVADSEDPALWQQVFMAIQTEDRLDDQGASEAKSSKEEKIVTGNKVGTGSGTAWDAFARELNCEATDVQGALDPNPNAPFITLEARNWEAFKKNTPARGRNAVSPLQLAGTLLCLWFKNAGMEGLPSQADAAAVLKGLGVVDKNPSRSIKNCDWLQARSGGIQINPARLSEAVRVARAFVTMKPMASD